MKIASNVRRERAVMVRLQSSESPVKIQTKVEGRLLRRVASYRLCQRLVVQTMKEKKKARKAPFKNP